MSETLSEYLNLLNVRGQTWCYVDIRADHGFGLPGSNAVLFYMVISGSVQITGITGGVVRLGAGEMAAVLCGDEHAVRSHANCATSELHFLCDEQMVDIPPTFIIGDEGPIAARMVCAKLRVDWPKGLHQALIPLVMQLRPEVVAADKMAIVGTGPGSAAIMTRFAELVLLTSLRSHLQCSPLFRSSRQPDPILRAVRIIESDPGAEWSIPKLARRVGMGRSTFSSYFKARIGLTPMEMITDLRMQQAATLLQRNLKHKEVSERVGYRSEAAFSRRFKLHFGMSPTDMKRDEKLHGDPKSNGRCSGPHLSFRQLSSRA